MKRLTVAALLLLGALFAPKPALALPTFAKAYGISCSVCHTIPPQLNSYGRYVQRTGYAALDRSLLKGKTPVTYESQPTVDTSTGSGHVEFGNIALHAAGYLSPDITYHIHQWLAQNGQVGDLDTMQVTYSRLFHGDGHLFAGKLSALPVPAPFSNTTDLGPFASAELQVGEHMYQFDMMRWGAELSYVRPTYFAQAAWFGSNAGLLGATDFSPGTDKTFQWIASYADSGRPLEAGLYGSVGSFPLAEGGVDRYHTIAAYVQRDPGPRYVPGLFATYQWGTDSNPGAIAMGGAMPAISGAAQSRALTAEMYEPLFESRAILGLRYEFTNDGLGTLNHSGDIDLAITPLTRYEYLRLFLESGLQQRSGPAWRGMLWWAIPVGGSSAH